MLCGLLPRRLPIRVPLAATGAILTCGDLLMPGVTTDAAGLSRGGRCSALASAAS